MGALEGLRHGDGTVAPGELTTLGLASLDTETNSRNRLLIYEMLVASGGEEGLSAVEQIVREGEATELSQTVEMLAMKMEPARALALFQEVLAGRELEGEAKQALYNAMGLVPGDEGRDFLLGLAQNAELDDAERVTYDSIRAATQREIVTLLEAGGGIMAAPGRNAAMAALGAIK